MVNRSHDIVSYEKYDYKHGSDIDISDLDILYNSWLLAKKNSKWKPQVQKFGMDWLSQITKLQNELRNNAYEISPSNDFIVHERGKIRKITSENIRDRVVKHAICDYKLMPAIQKHLIYDNGASQKHKGIDFTRRRLITHLSKYYRENGSNDGYILLIDFSKYYDNMRHSVLLDIFDKLSLDDITMNALKKIIESSRIDVSYMDEEEYSNCLNSLFDSLKYEEIDKSKLTGEKFMNKHMNIGDQVAQVAGICYPMKLDNYIKIVKGIKFYSRYMDDSYIIHNDKDFLKSLLTELIDIANSIGITINQKKTRICKLSDYWRFLQIQYSLTETGRIIQKIHPKRITSMRRKMKKLVHRMDEKSFSDWYKSWYESQKKYMSYKQKQSINSLFSELKKVYKNEIYNDVG